MASNYGLNFGFRRSDESTRISEGRFRTPVAGDPLLLGQLVAIDPDSAGFLKVATSGEVGDGGTVGLLVQEEIWWRSIYGPDAQHLDSFMLGVAKNNCQSVIAAGPGTKVWIQNTAAQTRADGRVIAAVTMVDLTDVGVLDFLTWNGTGYEKGTNGTDSMLRVTEVNVTAGYVEAVLVH